MASEITYKNPFGNLFCAYKYKNHKLWFTSLSLYIPKYLGDYEREKNWIEAQEMMELGDADFVITCDHHPAIIFYNQLLYCVFKGKDTDYLYYTTYNDETYDQWSAVMELNYQSDQAPALAVFDGKLFCVFRHHTEDHYLKFAYFDGKEWSDAYNFSDYTDSDSVYTVSGYPALSVFNDRLYCAYIDSESQHILSCYYDGFKWSEGKKLKTIEGDASGFETSSSVALGINTPSIWHMHFLSKLFCLFRDNDNDKMKFSFLSSNYSYEQGWSTPLFMEDTGYSSYKSSKTPALAERMECGALGDAFEITQTLLKIDHLYCVFKGHDDDILRMTNVSDASSSNPVLWTEQEKLDDTNTYESSSVPALTRTPRRPEEWELQRLQDQFEIEQSDLWITDNTNVSYNCIGWSLGYEDKWIQPVGIKIGGIECMPLNVFVEICNRKGYIMVDKDSDDVLIDGWGVADEYGNIGIAHATRFYGGDLWSSKLGPEYRITHPRQLQEKELEYGNIMASFKRDESYSVDTYAAVQIDSEPITESERIAISEEINAIPQEIRDEFNKAFETWKNTWFTGAAKFRSDTRSNAQGSAYKVLIDMDIDVLSLVIEKLLDPRNFVALVLYDELQTDIECVIQYTLDDPYLLEGERNRCLRTIRLWLDRNK